MSLGWPPCPLLQKRCMVCSKGPATSLSCMDGGGADVRGGNEKGVNVPWVASPAPRFVDGCFGFPGAALAQELMLCMVQAVLQAVCRELVRRKGGGQAAGGPF